MQAFYSVPFARFLQDAGISPHYRMGSDFMRAKPVAVEDQHRLIMECRSSGLTDYQWCIEHDIKPGTFYNWVKRLRQKGMLNSYPVWKMCLMYMNFRMTLCVLWSAWMKNHTNCWVMQESPCPFVRAITEKQIVSMSGTVPTVFLHLLNHLAENIISVSMNTVQQLTGHWLDQISMIQYTSQPKFGLAYDNLISKFYCGLLRNVCNFDSSRFF